MGLFLSLILLVGSTRPNGYERRKGGEGSSWSTRKARANWKDRYNQENKFLNYYAANEHQFQGKLASPDRKEAREIGACPVLMA